MRVLVVHPGPRFSVADVHNGWVKGLRQHGCEVADFNFDDRLSFYAQAHRKVGRRWKKMLDPSEAAVLASKGIVACCYEFCPDIVVIVSGFFVPPEIYATIRGHGTTVVLLHTESPYEDDRQTVRARHADLNLVNDPTNLDRFPPGTLYAPHAYDPDVHHPRPVDPDLECDFAFVGTGFPSRIRFLEAVDWSGINVTLAGNWIATSDDSPLRKFIPHSLDECCPNDETVRLYTSARASMNLYRQEATDTADGWAMGPREVELAACGVFFLRQPRGEGDALLPMLPTFTTPEDFEATLRWWLAHDDERRDAARAASAAVAGRTFAANAALLLNAV